MTDRIIVLITGANRGIGNALLSTYLARPQHTVIAGVRDLTNVEEKLRSLEHGPGSQVIPVKLDSASENDSVAAIETLKTQHGLTKLDIVIANAGISSYFGKALVTPAAEMLNHFTINAVAPLLLFQATSPLLNAAKNPKFIVVSSGAGSLGMVEKLPVENTAYGASKAAVNFVCRRIHYENPWLTAFSLNPGWLQTDLGNHAAKGAGMDVAPMSVEDGVRGMIEQIDHATREKASGKFLASTSEEIPWSSFLKFIANLKLLNAQIND